MNLLCCTVGRRGYIVDYFRKSMPKGSKIYATSDRHGEESEFTSGFFYCDDFFIVSSIKNEEQYISDLLKICEKKEVDFLLSFYDLDNFVLSKHLDKFNEVGTKPIISSENVNAISFDKIKTYEFLKSQGFNSPWTLDGDTALDSNIPSFPVIVKPRYGFGSSSIHVARNKDEMKFFLKYHQGEDFIVQEMLNAQEYSFDILNDLNGKNITAVVKKKIRMRSGETDQGYAIENKHLQSIAIDLGNKLAHVGPMDVDFFLVNDQPYILELNPRFGGGYPITHLAGVDFTKIITDMVCGELKTTDNSQFHQYNSGIVAIKDIKILQTNCSHG